MFWSLAISRTRDRANRMTIKPKLRRAAVIEIIRRARASSGFSFSEMTLEAAAKAIIPARIYPRACYFVVVSLAFNVTVRRDARNTALAFLARASLRGEKSSPFPLSLLPPPPGPFVVPTLSRATNFLYYIPYFLSSSLCNCNTNSYCDLC